MSGLTLTLLLHAGSLTAGQITLGPPVVESNPDKREMPNPEKKDMVLRWNDAALNAIRKERTPPPMAARNLAIMHIAVYDAVNSITRTHKPYAVEVMPPANTSPEAAAAAAAYTVLVALYPRQELSLEGALRDCLAGVLDGDACDRGVELGRSVAKKILDLRRNDKADRARGTYTARYGPGAWAPTTPNMQPLYPDWGWVECFAIKPGTQRRPPGPPALRSSAYAAAFQEVKTLGGKHSTVRSREQTDIALFWADNAGTATPPGHWNQIAQTVARQRGNTLAENARLLRLNISLADAGVLCWILKFTYDLWRPVTAIRRADQDDNPDTAKDPDWEPLLESPPFPSYTSGHSTFSAAAASVLANFYGTDAIRFSTTSEGLPGVTRTFPGFWAAADEAGMSRIYGGIHYQFDNTDGLACGKHLGTYIYRTQLRARTAVPPVIMESR